MKNIKIILLLILAPICVIAAPDQGEDVAFSVKVKHRLAIKPDTLFLRQDATYTFTLAGLSRGWTFEPYFDHGATFRLDSLFNLYPQFTLNGRTKGGRELRAKDTYIDTATLTLTVKDAKGIDRGTITKTYFVICPAWVEPKPGNGGAWLEGHNTDRDDLDSVKRWFAIRWLTEMQPNDNISVNKTELAKLYSHSIKYIDSPVGDSTEQRYTSIDLTIAHANGKFTHMKVRSNSMTTAMQTALKKARSRSSATIKLQRKDKKIDVITVGIYKKTPEQVDKEQKKKRHRKHKTENDPILKD